MALTFNSDILIQGEEPALSPQAPVIEGIAANTFLISSSQDGVGFNHDVNISGGRVGCRVPLLATADLTTHRYVSFNLGSAEYNQTNQMETVDNGGTRFVFVDGSGNYAGYNVWGSDIDGFDAGRATLEGWWNSFQGIIDYTRPLGWYIDREATPAISSATPVDWSDIVAVEFTVAIRTGQTDQPEVYLRRLTKYEPSIVTGTETFEGIYQASSARSRLPTGNIQTGDKTRPGLLESSAAQGIYTTRLGIQIGDGVTQTSIVESDIAIGLLNTWDYKADFTCIGPFVALNPDGLRVFEINQSATDVADFTACSFASSYNWQFYLHGSGTLDALRCSFFRATAAGSRPGFEAAHGSYVDCAWEDCSDLTITADTSITGGVYRNQSAGDGLVVDGAPGDYSAVDLRIANNVGVDLTLGSGGAGTYDLSGLTIQSGYTLKVHNNSANDITVQLPLNTVTSVTTDGGTVTIDVPSVLSEASIVNIVDGSRLQIFNTTTDTEIVNQVVSGTSYTADYAEGSDYTAGDVIRVRLTHVDGVTASLPFQSQTVAGSGGWAVFADQLDDGVYDAIGVDGSGVSGFTANYVDETVSINSDFSAGDLYAWWSHNLTTEDGIRNFFGSLTALDQGNFVINSAAADIYIDNAGATSRVQTDNRRIFRDDGAYPVLRPTTGGGGVDVVWKNQILIAETGVSGLTAQESSVLLGIQPDLEVINRGVKKASILVPHNEDL